MSIAGPAVIVTGGQCCCLSARRRPGGLASSAEVELKGPPGILGTGSDRLRGSWLGSRVEGLRVEGLRVEVCLTVDTYAVGTGI